MRPRLYYAPVFHKQNQISASNSRQPVTCVRLMAVVMGGSSRAARDNMARRLAEAGFAAPGSPTKVKRLMAGRRR